MNYCENFESKLLGESYTKVKHKSGLDIYVLNKNMSGYYAIFSTKFGGSVAEYMCDGERVALPFGCAHFLEHKLFDNEDGIGADDIFSSYGAYDNAYTSSERTAYLFGSSDNFDECLEELLTFVTRPYFTDKSVKKEIGIIAEEIRGCMDDPYDRCYMNMLDGMYFYNGVKNEICGTEESISNLSPEILYQCCRDFYNPENMVLCVCGNVDMQRVEKIVDKCIKIPEKKRDIQLIPYNEPAQVKRVYSEKKMAVSKPIMCVGIKDINIPDNSYERMKKSECAGILCSMMFSQSGQFYLDMLNEGLISPGFDCGYSINKNTAYVEMTCESDDPEKLVEKIKSFINDFKMEEFDAVSFEREKRAAYAAYVSDFDSTSDIAFALLGSSDDEVGLFEYIDLLNSITPDDMISVLNEIFKIEYMSVSVIYPI